MSFSALRDRLPTLPVASDAGEPWPRIGRGGHSFSDDIALPGGRRLGVRVRLTDRDGGGYCIDLRDSDEPGTDCPLGLGPARALDACLLALGTALHREPTTAWRDRIELLTDPSTWVGGADASDPAAIALGMARTFDAALGALANAWPGKVGAGSCSVGAMVQLSDGNGVVLTEVLPGGEGGTPKGPGRSAWAGPIVASPWDPPPTVEGVSIDGEPRTGSGGTGKHDGGHGIIRRYRTKRSLVARLVFDRVINPPHGIDRAGPPQGTLVHIEPSDLTGRQRVEPWVDVPLPAGSTLVVQTCGGAGWGFPGYGEIEWDPSEWFGGKQDDS
ncbi:MAG: hydantoinase B/oxoprolinase family protein [Myxococcota bacterium]